MHFMHIRNLDFNLLVVFDAVMRLGSASAAADALGMSQSGVSHALARLRDVVGDPLFLRRGGKLVATPRAEAMARPVHDALARLMETVTQDTTFDPATAAREFRVIMPDNVELIAIPQLIAACQSTAPGVTLRVRPGFARGHMADLLEGRLHLGFDLEPPREEGLDWRVWERYSMELIARKNHPAFQNGPISMDDFLALGHILYYPPELSAPPLETAIRRMGIQRRIVAHVASTGTLIAAAANSDAVAIVPKTFVTIMATLAPVTTHPLPFDPPELETYLWWSAKLTADPAHGWFRELLLRTSLRPAGAAT